MAGVPILFLLIFAYVSYFFCVKVPLCCPGSCSHLLSAFSICCICYVSDLCSRLVCKGQISHFRLLMSGPGDCVTYDCAISERMTVLALVYPIFEGCEAWTLSIRGDGERTSPSNLGAVLDIYLSTAP